MLLYNEVDAFLHQYHIALTTALKKFIAVELLNDTTYKKFHIDRK